MGGDTLRKGIYLVSKGHMELRCREAVPQGTVNSLSNEGRCLGILVPGCAFGTSVTRMPEPFSVVAMGQCEVPCAAGRDIKQLPLSLRFIMAQELPRPFS